MNLTKIVLVIKNIASTWQPLYIKVSFSIYFLSTMSIIDQENNKRGNLKYKLRLLRLLNKNSIHLTNVHKLYQKYIKTKLLEYNISRSFVFWKAIEQL